ncbi:hypothetical protein ACORG1_31160 [Mycobacterium sp. TJFP1]
MDASQLSACAARIAEHYRRSGSAEADRWFRDALEGPDWQEWRSRFTSVQALAGYIDWALPRDQSLCAMLCRQMIDDAVLAGPLDRADIAEERHKPLRLDYGRADNNEWARRSVLRHAFAEHCRSTSRRLEVLLVLAENEHFGRDDDRELVSRAFAEARGGPLNLAAIESTAWDLVDVILRGVIPNMLRTVRCDSEATDFEAAFLPVGFSPSEHLFVQSAPPDYFDPSAELTTDPALEADYALDRLIGHWGELRTLLTQTLRSHSDNDYAGRSRYAAAIEETEVRAALNVIAQCGFGHRRFVRIHGATSPGGPDLEPFRLLRGTQSWLAMWLATTTDLPQGLVRGYS